MSTKPLLSRGILLRSIAVMSFIAVIAILAGITSDKRANAAPADDEKAIRAVLDAQVTAWNKGDLDGFMAGYWNDDKLFYISGANAAKGWKALKERYQKVYQADGKEMGKLNFSELNVEVLDANAALVRGKWQVTLSKETIGGWFTLLFRKVPGGWKVTHDHTSK